jgi:hypothetical protein
MVDTDPHFLTTSQTLIERIISGAAKYDINDCKTPPGKKGFWIKSQIIKDSIDFLAVQIHNRSRQDLPYMVKDRPRALDVEHFNTTEIYHEGETWRAIVLTYNMFIIRRYGVWRILTLYCVCTGMKCNKYCLCHRFCIPCCELCFRRASPYKKVRSYQHVLEDTTVDAEMQYMSEAMG